MTTQVVIQVDSLTSLVDNPVGPQNGGEVRQPVTVGQQSLATVPSAAPSPPSSSSEPAASSSSASSSSSSSSSASSSLYITQSDQDTNLDNTNEVSQSSSPPSPSAEGSSSGAGQDSGIEGCSSKRTKKRKMGVSSNMSSDSGIPMDGVELDSSTLTNRTGDISQQQLASTTENSTLATSSVVGTPRLLGPNEALAASNLSPPASLCNESKFLGSSSPEHGPNGSLLNSDIDDSFRSSQHDNNNKTNSQQQPQQNNNPSTQHNPHHFRSFGDLFDDSDLD